MKLINLDFGKKILSCSVPGNWSGDILDSVYKQSDDSLELMVRQALENPIESPELKKIVSPGESVCIIFSDITRSWQRTDLYLPLIVEELEAGGVRPEDITLLCALGTHRKHSEEEKKRLTGILYGNYRIIDHDCDDYQNLVKVGLTSRGTAVELNKAAVTSDRLILTGGLIFHLMVGYSAGRKSIVPGISSRSTIMQNHSLSLAPEKGKGSHPLIGCARLTDNPLHEDLMEAQEMLRPDFIVNILPGRGAPGAAVAGHYLKAHEEGCRLLREIFLVPAHEKRRLVIASAGGFPGDINFYQSVKSMINASQALSEGGTLLLVARCQEGLGDSLMQEMIEGFSSMKERELFLRDNYTIGRFIAYYGCEMASRFKVILVTDMDEPSLGNIDITCFRDLQTAVNHIAEETERTSQSFWMIPDAAHTFPQV